MRNKALMISVAQFKEYNGIDSNVSTSVATSAILKAQRKYIEGILSSALYFHLMDQIATGNLTTDEEYLLREYVGPALSEYAYYQFTLTNTFQSKAVGLIQPTETNSSIVSMKDLANFRHTLMNEAEATGERLVNYILKNRDKFPKYDNKTSEGDVKTVVKTYFSGIYMPSNRKKREDK